MIFHRIREGSAKDRTVEYSTANIFCILHRIYSQKKVSEDKEHEPHALNVFAVPAADGE
jgi:hypothetical protein